MLESRISDQKYVLQIILARISSHSVGCLPTSVEPRAGEGSPSYLPSFAPCLSFDVIFRVANVYASVCPRRLHLGLCSTLTVFVDGVMTAGEAHLHAESASDAESASCGCGRHLPSWPLELRKDEADSPLQRASLGLDSGWGQLSVGT